MTSLVRVGVCLCLSTPPLHTADPINQRNSTLPGSGWEGSWEPWEDHNLEKLNTLSIHGFQSCLGVCGNIFP